MLYHLHFRQHYVLSTSDDPGNSDMETKKFLLLSRQDCGLFAAKTCFEPHPSRRDKPPPKPSSAPSAWPKPWAASPG
jgi:hypothetical protein